LLPKYLRKKNSRPEDKNFDREIAAKLQRYGKTLHTLLFPPELSFSDAQELIFSVDAAWARLPFELLPLNRATESLAGLQVPILRQIRTVQKVSPVAETKKAERRFLLLANTEGSADIAPLVEKEKISLMNTRGYATQMKILGHLAGVAQVVEEFAHCEYLHYAGHVHDQSLRLREAALRADDITAMSLGNIKLAFVNGCNSAGEHGQTGLARAFLSAGVKNYIGYNYAVSDAAALFAAGAVWRDFLRRENMASLLNFFYRRRKKPLAEIALSLRRAIFEKFGAAELAWLGIQFFIGPEEQRRQNGKRFSIAAAALLVVALAMLFLMQDRIYQPAEKQLKIPASQAAKQRGKKATKPPEPQVSTGLLYEKPAVIAAHSRREKLPAIQSPVLANLVTDFRAAVHPFYTREDKEDILRDILDAKVSESSKIIRLRNEMP
jgi:hypothetical protein